MKLLSGTREILGDSGQRKCFTAAMGHIRRSRKGSSIRLRQVSDRRSTKIKKNSNNNNNNGDQ